MANMNFCYTVSHTSQLRALTDRQSLGIHFTSKVNFRCNWAVKKSELWPNQETSIQNWEDLQKSLQDGHAMSIPVCSNYSMLQPDLTAQFQRGATHSLPKSLITILDKTRRLRYCVITIPAIVPRSVPLQRGHLYPTVIPRTTIPMNCLQGKQPATSTCKMPPLQAGAIRTILCFPKFQHQRAEQGKGLTSGKTQSDSPRTHSHKQTI